MLGGSLPASYKVCYKSFKADLFPASVFDVLDKVSLVCKVVERFFVKLPGACFYKSTPACVKVSLTWVFELPDSFPYLTSHLYRHMIRSACKACTNISYSLKYFLPWRFLVWLSYSCHFLLSMSFSYRSLFLSSSSTIRISSYSSSPSSSSIAGNSAFLRSRSRSFLKISSFHVSVIFWIFSSNSPIFLLSTVMH